MHARIHPVKELKMLGRFARVLPRPSNMRSRCGCERKSRCSSPHLKRILGLGRLRITWPMRRKMTNFSSPQNRQNLRKLGPKTLFLATRRANCGTPDKKGARVLSWSGHFLRCKHVVFHRIGRETRSFACAFHRSRAVRGASNHSPATAPWLLSRKLLLSKFLAQAVTPQNLRR